MKHPFHRSALLISTLALAAACAETEPLGVDTGEAALAAFSYACSGFHPAQPEAATVLADVTFPGTVDLGLVRRHGGTPVYRFHVERVRVVIPTASIPALAADGSFIKVDGVTDRADHSVPLFVHFADGWTEADVQRVQARGAVVTHRYETLPFIAVDIEDEKIPQLRALPRVEEVEKVTHACLG